MNTDDPKTRRYLPVLDDSLPLLSASQISSFRLCNRAWGWDKLAKVPRDEHGSTIIGSRVHELLEEYLKNAQIPDTEETLTVKKKDGSDRTVRPGFIAQKGIRFLPAPGTGTTEGYFVFYYDGVRFHGYIDWHKISETFAHILDHKTTGSYKWMKTEEILREKDEQSAIYACYAWAMGADSIALQWVYYLATGSSGSRNVVIHVTPDDVREMMQPVVDAGRQMYEYIERWGQGALQVTDLPYDPTACGAFGGCSYVERCNLSSEERLSAYFRFKDDKMDLLAMLNGQNGSQAINSPTTPPSNPTAAAPPVAHPAPADPKKGQQAPPTTASGSIMDLLNQSAAPAAVVSAPPVAPVAPSSPVAAIAPASAPVAQAAPSVAQGGALFGTLYVSCRPNSAQLVEGAKLIEYGNKMLQDHKGVAHWSLVEFGHGQAMVIEALKTATGLQGRDLCVDRRTFPPNILEWLRSASAVVVEGF